MSKVLLPAGSRCIIIKLVLPMILLCKKALSSFRPKSRRAGTKRRNLLKTDFSTRLTSASSVESRLARNDTPDDDVRKGNDVAYQDINL
jgi:hypothetical protein